MCYDKQAKAQDKLAITFPLYGDHMSMCETWQKLASASFAFTLSKDIFI